VAELPQPISEVSKTNIAINRLTDDVRFSVLAGKLIRFICLTLSEGQFFVQQGSGAV
jgi:hypothetical protein